MSQSSSLGTWIRRLVVVIAVWAPGMAAAAPPRCTNLPPPLEGQLPIKSDCCEDVAYNCNGMASPGLVGGRKNVLLAILDDHGYCTTSFMLGRCVDTSLETRCDEPACIGAPWIRCPSGDPAIDCPPGTSACTNPGSLGRVCTTDPSQSCTTPDTCPEPGCGEAKDCVAKCSNRFVRRCATPDECGDNSLTCVDGVCSPRQECEAVGGGPNDYVCARGVGKCQANDTCFGSGQPCSRDADCNDVCLPVGGVHRCVSTPKLCARNEDCPGANQICTTSQRPLRLNDVSCRYRQPGDESWEYDPTVVPPAGEQLVHTPEIDRLALEGAVFPRGRAGGDSCKPNRAALQFGRILRHRNASFANNAAKDGGSCRAAPLSLLDTSLGCNADDANGEGECRGQHCDDRNSPPPPALPAKGGWHLVQWWLQDMTGEAFLNGQAVRGARTVAGAKTENTDAASKTWDETVLSGSSNLGKFKCDVSTGCPAALKAGRIPFEAVNPSSNNSVGKFLATLTEGQTHMLQEPFFGWYGVNIPHTGVGPNEIAFFRDLYATPPGTGGDDGERHLARTSLFDAGMGAIVDELKRTCVCGPGGAKQSLWDHTVVIVTPDNAFLLPESKNVGPATLAPENAHRVPIVIREPGSPVRAKVLDEQEQFAAHWDILPTVLDYINGYTDPDVADQLDRYPLNHNLSPWVAGGMSTPDGPVRDIIYAAENGVDTNPVGNSEGRYLIPRAGKIGKCAPPTNRLCLIGDVIPPTETCTCNPVRMCVSKPPVVSGNLNLGAVCTSDDGCASCNGGTCGNDFPDFAGKPCSTARDCAPIGVCRPPLVKVVKSGDPGSISRIFELNSDPDQTDNLAGSNLLLPSLRTDFESCLNEFWKLTGANGEWIPVSMGCPDCMRSWPTCGADPATCVFGNRSCQPTPGG